MCAATKSPESSASYLAGAKKRDAIAVLVLADISGPNLIRCLPSLRLGTLIAFVRWFAERGVHSYPNGQNS